MANWQTSITRWIETLNIYIKLNFLTEEKIDKLCRDVYAVVAVDFISFRFHLISFNWSEIFWWIYQVCGDQLTQCPITIAPISNTRCALGAVEGASSISFFVGETFSLSLSIWRTQLQRLVPSFTVRKKSRNVRNLHSFECNRSSGGCAQRVRLYLHLFWKSKSAAATAATYTSIYMHAKSMRNALYYSLLQFCVSRPALLFIFTSVFIFLIH